MLQPSPFADRLDEAVAEYLAAVESGVPPDRDELLSRYGDIAQELTGFFADHDRLTGLAQPLRTLIAAQTDASRGAADTHSYPRDSASGVDQHSVVGQRIGDFEILRELGRGGMGVVYQARHVHLNRIVALKMVLAGQFANQEEIQRFDEEARSAAALDHPGIVALFETGRCDGQPFFSMAYVQGPSLSQILEAGPLPPLAAVRLFRKIVSAVSYAHEHGVIHRDLKPANILLEESGQVSGGVARGADPSLLNPKITDFGLAKRMGDESHLTASGQLLGTPLYMSPEQASGRTREIGPPADIYALGAILYVMLTGRPPFASDNPVEVILQVLESDPPLPRRLRPEIPADLECICLKCLEKQPGDRYATAADLAEDLDRYLRREPIEARSPSPAQRMRRWMRRQPVLAWHVICLGVLLALIQVIYVGHPLRDVSYHLRISGVLGLWLVASFGCHWLQGRDDRGTWWHQFWIGADAAFLTVLLSLLAPPLGPLLGSYLALICISGLFFQTRLVAFTTAAAAIASVVLFLLRPEEARPLHYAVLFETSLVMTGLIIGYQVWRLSVLREYYDDRRPR
jgi:serine/threonine protein kinase